MSVSKTGYGNALVERFFACIDPTANAEVNDLKEQRDRFAEELRTISDQLNMEDVSSDPAANDMDTAELDTTLFQKKLHLEHCIDEINKTLLQMTIASTQTCARSLI